MVKREKKSGISPFAIIVFVLLIVYTATFLVPLIWGVNISLKTDNNAELHPFGLNLPLMFKNYGTVFKEFSVTVYPAGAIEPQVYYMENMLWFTLVYAVACSFVNIAVTCLVAYVTARFNFRICRIIDAVVIVAMILPIVGSMPSELRIMRALGMYDTLWGMMIMKANFVGGTTFLIFNVAFKGFPKDFEEAAQIDGAGYSLVEVVATCPTNWGMTPQDSFAWMRENMLPYYPLGVYKDVRADGFANAAEAAAARAADCPIANPAPTEGGAR